MMDFHAHLDRHEVIGLLAGSWQPEHRLLTVERALPVHEAVGSGAANDGINVEMDPEDQFKVRVWPRLCMIKLCRLAAHTVYMLLL
jgi:protein MYSM1